MQRDIHVTREIRQMIGPKTALMVDFNQSLQPTEAIRRVNTSNWTKIDTVTGEFIRDGQGKIMKPSGYQPPDLEGLY